MDSFYISTLADPRGREGARPFPGNSFQVQFSTWKFKINGQLLWLLYLSDPRGVRGAHPLLSFFFYFHVVLGNNCRHCIFLHIYWMIPCLVLHQLHCLSDRKFQRLVGPLYWLIQGGVRNVRPLSVQILKFLCSFRQKSCQIMGVSPKIRGWAPPSPSNSPN